MKNESHIEVYNNTEMCSTTYTPMWSFFKRRAYIYRNLQKHDENALKVNTTKKIDVICLSHKCCSELGLWPPFHSGLGMNSKFKVNVSTSALP